MPTSLPYLLALKNIPALFDKIATAKVPDKFTHQFLQTTLGLKSTADRQLIPFLRHLGFLDQSGTPTASYNLLKASLDKRAAAIAAGVRKAYQPLFDADHSAHQLTGDKLKSLVAQIAGTDADLTGRIAGTFQAIVRLGDFDAKVIEEDTGRKNEAKEQEKKEEEETAPRPKELRTEFHYNIQVHLPSNATEETYQNIFNALRKTFE
jgi:hypothetical protein